MFNRLSRVIPKLIPYGLALLANKMHDFYWKPKGNKNGDIVTLADIDEFLKSVSIKQGDTLFLHSSWQALENADFTAAELVAFLGNYLGEDGTLAMPAFPADQSGKKEFNLKHTPSAAGLLTEVFRRYPGVKRSINLNHSVCALGKQADVLVSEHHLSKTSWDKKSPYFKLSSIDNAWIVGFGVGHRLKVATSLHCVESLLWQSSPYFNKLFGEENCYQYVDQNGNKGKHCYLKRSGPIYTPKLAKYFTEEELIEQEIKELQVYAIRAPVLINKAIDLGKQGKTMYIWPIPFPWLFKGVK